MGKSNVRVYSAYDTPDDPGITCPEVSLASQSSKNECDINYIVDKFLRTGQIPPEVRERVYADVSGITDLASSLAIVERAEAAFMELPANVRSAFGNDPVLFVQAVNDPSQQANLVALGVAVQKDTPPPVQPAPAPSVSQPATSGQQ